MDHKIGSVSLAILLLISGCGGGSSTPQSVVETNYINANTPMSYICSCGSESKIQFKHFKNGSRCYKCGLNKQKRFGSENHYWISDRDYVEQREIFSRKCLTLLNYL
jgi:hypothetical protein